ncbi:DUF4358 domain-containing protein [Allofournierella massiliensis]|uniref:Uncharacterized protein DUF4358 n=1 Tax=Allofournierella massiliensis TaxID=1650663 RepID=A0A4R1QV71_9FIRM|nr:DUF4358 domain-containing protein [Fournierella massiliensis]TCL57838.1 uncharacterized protein DUF4358 [Fournierella massiliensis]
MKRLISILLAGVLAAGLVGCASSGADSAASHTPADYTAALADSRTEEDNSNYTIFTLEDGSYTASKGYAEHLDSEAIASQGQMSLEVLGLAAEDVQSAAYSVSLMNVKAYGVAIVKPAEGKTDAVKEALSGFIEAQKSAQENYLADQYAIAKAAKLETLKSGEVVLVMCENQDQVFQSIETALK